MSFKDTFLGLVIVLVWGVNFVVIAWGLEDFPPMLMGGLRFLLVAIVGLLFIPKPAIPFRFLVAYGLTLGFGQFAFLFTAMTVGMPAGLASLVLQAQILFSILFAWLFLQEIIKPHQLVAMIVASAGLALIGWTAEESSMTAIGFALTLAGASCWAVGNMVIKIVSQRGYKVDIGLVVWSAWVPPIPFFIMSFFLEQGEVAALSFQSVGWVSVSALIYLSVVATILAYSLWVYLLSRYPASQVTPLTLGVPVVGLVCAALLLNEQISLLKIYGIAMVLFGLGFNIWGQSMMKKIMPQI